MCGYIVITIPVVGESGSFPGRIFDGTRTSVRTYVGISAASLYKTNDVIPTTFSKYREKRKKIEVRRGYVLRSMSSRALALPMANP